MKQINIHDAKTHLSEYLADLRPGDEIILCKRNVPVAKIVSLSDPLPREEGGMTYGLGESVAAYAGESDETKAKLTRLAEQEGRSPESLAAEALEQFLALREVFNARLNDALAEADRGDFADPAEVAAFFAPYVK